MTKYSTNNFSIINLHKKASIKSEIVTQMIYGESFSISKKTKKWLKIKIKEDDYKGYVVVFFVCGPTGFPPVPSVFHIRISSNPITP